MMVARKELIAAGMSACRQRLEAMGFQRHAADIFTLLLSPRLLGWVALGRAINRGDGSMAITPGIGLLHQEVERLVAECATLPYHRYYPATAQTSIGLLTPEMTPDYVVFPPDEPVDRLADQVCQSIHDYGLPWMREHASLSAIQALDGNNRYRISLSTRRRAVIAWVLGHPDLARQYLDYELATIAERGGPSVVGSLEVSRRFAAALEARMAQGAWSPSERV